jgi:hypothetical protein
MTIDCICIDNSNKPEDIPLSKWLIERQEYKINHVHEMTRQGNIIGVEIVGLDLSDYPPYNCFRLTRFAVHSSDIHKLVRMVEECAIINNIPKSDVQSFIDLL